MRILHSGLLVLLFTACASTPPAPAERQTRFHSEVEGLDIPGSHWVGKPGGAVIRGMHPLGRAAELKEAGVTRVLIFKNEKTDEVRREKAELAAAGYAESTIRHVPFRWKEIPSFQEACEQLVDSLKFLRETTAAPGERVFLHCTLGEDRTGVLTGLYRMLTERMSAQAAFHEEMCENGYEAGNPRKPESINQPIRKELTPVFLRMAELVKAGKLRWDRLDASVCARTSKPLPVAGEFTCKPSRKPYRMSET
jgi:hypothetical protein